jgi:serine protease AprX
MRESRLVVSSVSGRHRTWALAAIAGTVLTAVAGLPAAAAAQTAAPLTGVIVQHDPSARAAARQAVIAAGGRVGQQLDIAGGFSATVPTTSLAEVRATAGVRAVTPNAPVRLKSDTWLADKDQNSLYNVTKFAGVHDAWSRSDSSGRKVTGQGIGVALIDSGIAPVKGLAGAGKVINGPDLSFESQASNLRHLDTFGHGTHMAGIIAGRDPEVKDGGENDSKYFVGVAPGAHIVNVKVAAADGATDVSQVIAAIDWVVAHRADPGLNIRVLNLSFGTDSVQDSRLDPLSYAVEAAWKKGIVVVVAVGNDGPKATRLSMPAINPYVLAVGASDPVGTDTRSDDIVASFSTRGNSVRRPDLVAPGKSVVSLRDPYSYIDVNYPGGLITTDTTKRFFRGSGTSQAAAVTSGAAALLLQQRPSLTPDQVKRLLTTTAEPMPAADSIARGAGQLNVKAAFDAPTPSYKQTHLPATGLGSLEKARGTARVADPATGKELTGEVDIMGQKWVASTWTKLALEGRTWSGGLWNGRTWSGADWSGSSWTGRTWSSVAWTGRTWSGATWAGRTWSGAVWDGRTWSGRTWSGRTWSGCTWAGDYWSGRVWR